MPPEAIPQGIIDGAQDNMDNIHADVKDYLFNFRRAAYRSLATSIRAVLLDKNSLGSFGKEWKSPKLSLFEAVYGPANEIFLPAMTLHYNKEDKTKILENSMPVIITPASWLIKLRSTDNMLSLPNWLKQDYVRTVKRGWITTERLLRQTASIEGAHVLNRTHRDDWRNEILTPVWGVETLDHKNFERGTRVVWEQFVVAAGIALLLASKRRQGQYTRIFQYDINGMSDEKIENFIDRNPFAKFHVSWNPPQREMKIIQQKPAKVGGPPTVTKHTVLSISSYKSGSDSAHR